VIQTGVLHFFFIRYIKNKASLFIDTTQIISMTACSFLPAATQMIYDMNLQHLLKGVTFECPPESREEKEIIVRCVLEGTHHTSNEIDSIFSAYKASGKSLYYTEDEKLEMISPDIIFTQDVCEVCQIDTKCTQASVNKLSKTPAIVTLTPQTLQDVFETVITIAKALEQEEAAYRHLAGLQQRINTIIDTLRMHRAPLKRVMLMEWTEPVYNCGHWIPYQISIAGGVDMLSNPGGDSMVISWDKIVRYNPEVLVIAPCGFEIHRTMEEIGSLTAKEGWSAIAAVQQEQVYIADYDLFTQPSASTLINGIEILAACFHPALFTVPARLQHKVSPLKQVAASFAR
jgi:iron complex transport system substrate-binding protein